jgi:hypothetical protein
MVMWDDLPVADHGGGEGCVDRYEVEREIGANGDIMSVSVTSMAGNGLEFSAPTPLFRSPLIQPTHQASQFDVTSDGRRFLFLHNPGEIGPITITLNWRNGIIQ